MVDGVSKRSTAGPSNHPVASLMRRRFITASPDDSISEARQTMRLARLRHLVVSNNGYLVGLLSYRDVLEHALAVQSDTNIGCGDDSVAAAMVPAPAWVSAERTLTDVAALILHTGLGCLPVVEPTETGPRLIGLLTETDLLRAAYDPLYRPS